MKVPILNVYYLLCYAWEMWQEGQLVNVSDESFQSLPELFAHVLKSGVAYLLRRGLDRNYLREEEELRSPQGKFDLSVIVKRTLMLRSRIHCVYDAFSHDVLHNQIIKTTLGRVARCKELDSTLRAESARLYRRLHEITEIELAPSTFQRAAIHRNNRFYAFLVEVCRILYHSLLVDPKTGQSVFREFLRDETAMSHLFERFVRRFYQREQTKYRVSAKAIDWVDVHAEPDDDREFLPTMKTDVTLESSARVIVIDTKYYASCLQTSQFGKATVHSANLYQLFAYLRNLEKQYTDGITVEGFLLYPAVGQPLDLRFRIHGHPVRVATLNLDQHWSGIRNRLLALIE